MSETTSQVTLLLHRIELEYEAAYQALTGLAAGNARHDFIEARQARIGTYHEQLQQLIGPQEAIKRVAETLQRL